jgi:hypothetical protein
MSIRKISKFLFILLSFANVHAQQDSTWERGLRVGLDVSRFAMTVFTPERKAREISFDTEVKPNWFVTIETGLENVDLLHQDSTRIPPKRLITTLKYRSNGFYGRIGFDYNILKRDDPRSRDVVFIGFRYGFYTMKQTTDWFTIYEPRYGDIADSYPSKMLNGHWIEGVFGCKVEVTRNFFMGLSMRERILLFSKNDINFPFARPGFGDGSTKAVLGVNYSLYYQIPLMKVKIIPKPKADADKKGKGKDVKSRK